MFPQNHSYFEFLHFVVLMVLLFFTREGSTKMYKTPSFSKSPVIFPANVFNENLEKTFSYNFDSPCFRILWGFPSFSRWWRLVGVPTNSPTRKNTAYQSLNVHQSLLSVHHILPPLK